MAKWLQMAAFLGLALILLTTSGLAGNIIPAQFDTVKPFVFLAGAIGLAVMAYGAFKGK